MKSSPSCLFLLQISDGSREQGMGWVGFVWSSGETFWPGVWFVERFGVLWAEQAKVLRLKDQDEVSRRDRIRAQNKKENRETKNEWGCVWTRNSLQGGRPNFIWCDRVVVLFVLPPRVFARLSFFLCAFFFFLPLVPLYPPMTLYVKCSMYTKRNSKQNNNWMNRKKLKNKRVGGLAKHKSRAQVWRGLQHMMTDIKRVNKGRGWKRIERDAWPGNIRMTSQAEGHVGDWKKEPWWIRAYPGVGFEGYPTWKIKNLISVPGTRGHKLSDLSQIFFFTYFFFSLTSRGQHTFSPVLVFALYTR